MQRVCFQLKPDRVDEYTRRHEAVWPEMLAALAATGWSNYSLFLRPELGLLIGYFETESLSAALAGMEATAVNARWQAEMAELFDDLSGTPDQGFTRLGEIFHLDDQLAALDVLPERPGSTHQPASTPQPASTQQPASSTHPRADRPDGHQ